MKVVKDIQELQSFLSPLKSSNKRIGLVPTMGALHRGHLSLIERSKLDNELTVVSIFINPTQFDKREDFLKYPQTLATDLTVLEKANCELVFTPNSEGLYKGNEVAENFDFEGLDASMEGLFRKNHFNGVGTIVRKLFDLVQPDNAYFGEKDFQQYLIIKKLTAQSNLPIQIHSCPIYREEDGLAMSSRNSRLSPAHRKAAPFVYKMLQEVKSRFANRPVSEIKSWVAEQFLAHPLLDLEYLEVADENTLEPVEIQRNDKKQRAFIAVFAQNIRLIDNIDL
jgi:pantoate--beta-alanine ligase